MGVYHLCLSLSLCLGTCACRLQFMLSWLCLGMLPRQNSAGLFGALRSDRTCCSASSPSYNLYNSWPAVNSADQLFFLCGLIALTPSEIIKHDSVAAELTVRSLISKMCQRRVVITELTETILPL